MRVDDEQSSLSSQVLRRQGDEQVNAMAAYVTQRGVLTPSDTGIILLPFCGISLVVAMAGVQVLDALRAVFDAAADKVDGAAAAYEARERQLYEAASRIAAQLGGGMPAYTDPRQNPPVLPGASGGAPAGHGDAEPWLFQQAADDGAALVTGTRRLVDQATVAAGSWVVGPTGVTERQDARSWLVTPNATKSEIESMRWGAGPLLGGIDWVFEQITGFSILEDVIMKPFAGNWSGIEEVSLAWQYLGDAGRAVGDNCAGLVQQGEFWDGDAGLAFRGGVAAIGAGTVAVAAACDYVSGVVANLLLVSKAAAAGIGMLLRQISLKLLRLAAEAAVPVAGWLVAAAEIAILVTEIFGWVKLIYTIVDTIFDVIESTVQAKAQLAETLLLVNDLAQFLVRTGARYAA